MDNVNAKPLTKLIDEFKPVFLRGKERNAIRSKLRKALKQGKLSIRTTYYDYYDSCHAPIKTPDAPWQRITMNQYLDNSRMFLRDLKAVGASIVDIGIPNVYQLNTGYSIKQVRIEESYVV